MDRNNFFQLFCEKLFIINVADNIIQDAKKIFALKSEDLDCWPVKH